MKLKTLYEIQGGLREHIDYNQDDKFKKMMLAMIIEFGECANDWRGFKYWSKDQESKPTVLEEYVDGFHFVLELGIDIGVQPEEIQEFRTSSTIEDQFLNIIEHAIFIKRDVMYLKKEDELSIHFSEIAYVELVEMYLGLGEMLGFTTDQIERAYLEKNKINHERQNSGY